MTWKKAMRIGYIGLGIMGKPMALNIQKAGFELHVWARRPEATQDLHGANVHPSLSALAQCCDVIFLNVSDTPDVEQLILGQGGLLEHSKPGTIIVDNSTISPDATRNIAKQLSSKGVEMLDAPVSGGDVGAIAGTLSIMVGGKADTFAQVKPLLAACGTHILHIGDHGAGQVCKACNQILVAQSMAAVGESLLLAKASGVDAAKVRQALLGGFAQSRILDIHGQRILDNHFTPGFKSELHHKDMAIALEAAEQGGLELPGAQLATQHLAAMLARDLGGEDSSAMCKIIAAHSNFPLFD